jgi:hypothetical protein
MASSRVVVVVPRQETQLHEYLQRSLACLKDVEVVLERRATRREPSANLERRILLCSIVHCAVPEPVPEPPATNGTDGTHLRTLLWPGLRLEHM